MDAQLKFKQNNVSIGFFPPRQQGEMAAADTLFPPESNSPANYALYTFVKFDHFFASKGESFEFKQHPENNVCLIK